MEYDHETQVMNFLSGLVLGAQRVDRLQQIGPPPRPNADDSRTEGSHWRQPPQADVCEGQAYLGQPNPLKYPA